MSHEGLIKKLRKKAGCFDYDGRPDIACDYEQAADAIEKLAAEVENYKRSMEAWKCVSIPPEPSREEQK